MNRVRSWELGVGSRGFTLIELMLVVIIIGILASIIVPKFAGRSEQARESAALANIKSIALALDLYELDNEGVYPDNLAALAPKYLKKAPGKDPWGTEYEYKYDKQGKSYTLRSCGPDKQCGAGDDNIEE